MLEVGLRDVLVLKCGVNAVGVEADKQLRANLTDPTLLIVNSGSIAFLNAGLSDPTAELIASHIPCIWSMWQCAVLIWLISHRL